MFIKEVCSLTMLTKKAVEYYEEQGLVSPKILASYADCYKQLEFANEKLLSEYTEIGKVIKQCE